MPPTDQLTGPNRTTRHPASTALHRLLCPQVSTAAEAGAAATESEVGWSGGKRAGCAGDSCRRL